MNEIYKLFMKSGKYVKMKRNIQYYGDTHIKYSLEWYIIGIGIPNHVCDLHYEVWLMGYVILPIIYNDI